uniref:Uncharacterized protein n=1 Tax=Arundo donax TaxID=35708 RepID=A0A0A8ZQ21_ARUDO
MIQCSRTLCRHRFLSERLSEMFRSSFINWRALGKQLLLNIAKVSKKNRIGNWR